MDILTHTISGLAVGTVLASFSKGGIRQQVLILCFSAFGGALPDMDAITLWSRFDATLGQWFGLQEPGKVIYSARFWYSHHGFMHSLAAAFIFALCMALFFCLKDQVTAKKKISLLSGLKSRYLLWAGFTGAYVIHLLEDMVTPGGDWEGIRFFFPLNIYVGGTGDVWWWNNYDIFLIVLTVVLLNLILLFSLRYFRYRVWRYTSLIFFTGFVIVMIQIKSGDYDFNKGEYILKEQKSLEIQRQRLSRGVYDRMVKFDKWLKIYF